MSIQPGKWRYFTVVYLLWWYLHDHQQLELVDPLCCEATGKCSICLLPSLGFSVFAFCKKKSEHLYVWKLLTDSHLHFHDLLSLIKSEFPRMSPQNNSVDFTKLEKCWRKECICCSAIYLLLLHQKYPPSPCSDDPTAGDGLCISRDKLTPSSLRRLNWQESARWMLFPHHKKDPTSYFNIFACERLLRQNKYCFERGNVQFHTVLDIAVLWTDEVLTDNSSSLKEKSVREHLASLTTEIYHLPN